jgi:hypothetical protein
MLKGNGPTACGVEPLDHRRGHFQKGEASLDRWHFNDVNGGDHAALRRVGD